MFCEILYTKTKLKYLKSEEIVRIFRALNMLYNMKCNKVLATILKTVFWGKKSYQFFFLVLSYNVTGEFVWLSSTPKTIAPWKRSHGTISCLILSLFYILLVFSCTMVATFERHPVFPVRSWVFYCLSHPTYYIRSSSRHALIKLNNDAKNIVHCAWSQVFTDNLKTWKFDDSVTVVELNLTNDTELIHKHKSCLLMYIFCSKHIKNSN